MPIKAYRVVLTRAVCLVEADDDGIIVATAPYLYRWKGRKLEDLKNDRYVESCEALSNQSMPRTKDHGD
jgi:hypothetical protein